MVTEEQIKELAHAIWEQEGRPEGKEVEHYFRAKKTLEEREKARIIELPAPPPVPELPPQAVTEALHPSKRKKSTRRKKN